MFRRFFALSQSDDVVTAQVEAFKRRVPILYAILAVNTLAMIATHWGEGSATLTLYLPMVFIVIMLHRAYTWHHIGRVPLDADRSRQVIKSTTARAVVLAAAMLVWTCYMYNMPVVPVLHGITGFGHAVLYVSLTVICCMSLLMHVRLAAVLVTTLVMGPFCIFLMIDGTIVERAVAINIGLVTLGMLYVVMVFSKDFETLVISRQNIRAAAEHEAFLAITDTLTGLTNRRNFFQVLEDRCFRRAQFSLYIIDLDGFKQINDLYGHLAGDEVLRQTGERIAEAYGARLALSRLGGDEFAIICGELDPNIVKESAMRVIAACQEPLFVNGAVVSVGASIGAVVVLQDDFGVEPTKHIERADYALSHAKQNGKGRVELFAVEHESRIRRQRLVEQTLRQADVEKEMCVAYQPIVCAKGRRLVGFEALVRWNSSLLGAVSPAEFIPLAELGGVIHQITRHVLTTALRDASFWPQSLRLKVNLSGRDLLNSIQMLEILSILGRGTTSPARVTFELTETSVVQDLSAVADAMAMIRAAGVSLAIDDFGTGYSSLSYIHALKPDLIKIDRSFTSRIGSGDNVESIIKTIVELCNNLGAKSLAEGVETEEQAQLLQSLGVTELQGYLIAKPLYVDQLSSFFPADQSFKN